jgi:arylformamidase
MTDITRALGEDTPVWPGDAPVQLSRDSWPKGGPYVSSVRMTLHAGTHADAPLHYDANGVDIAEAGLDSFVGPCAVLELPGGETRVEAAFFDRVAPGTERLLIKTPASALTGQAYIESAFGLTADAAERAVRAGLRLVGVDGPSVGVRDEEGDRVHRILLESGVAVVEGLDLSGAAEGVYTLCCLPLKLAGGEAAPVRAVLL